MSVYGLGYIGEGSYKVSKYGKHLKQYIAWKTMFARCYSLKRQANASGQAYKECEVSEEWLNYQTFAYWYDNNYYEIEGQKTHLDKDILIKGNKIYGPNQCVFVPSKINLLFTKHNIDRGDFPIGVSYHKASKKYKAECSNFNGGKTYLGLFNNPQDAFFVYKEYKEQLIKDVANQYKNIIPIKLFQAMMVYEVNVND